MIYSLLDLSNYFYAYSAWPPLIVGACSLVLGAIVLARERASYISRTFAALCSAVSLCYLSIGALYSSRDPNLGLWLARFSTVAVAFIPSTLLAFTIVIGRQYERLKWLSRLSLMISGILSVSVLRDHRVLLGLNPFPWGPYPHFGSLGFLFVGYFFAVYIGSLVLLYHWTFKKPLLYSDQERNKQLWLAFALGTLASVDFLACFRIEVYPIGYLPVYTSLLLLAQTIWRYRFAPFTPAFAAPHIVREMPSGLLVVDLEGQIEIANPRAADYLNRASTELLGASLADVLGSYLDPMELHRLIKEDALRDHEIVVPGDEARRRVLSLSASKMRGEEQAPIGFIVTLLDITRRQAAEEARSDVQRELMRSHEDLERRVHERTTELTQEVEKRKQAEEALRTQAITDALTGLYNRRGFMKLAGQNMERARREGRRYLVILGDIDDLKPLNDTYGHQAGDQALQQAAELLRATFRSSDIIARIGGDEFAVGAIEDAGMNEAILRQRLNAALHSFNETGQTAYRLGISIGSARLEPHHSVSLEHLLAEADAGLYQQKHLKPVSIPKPDTTVDPHN